MDSSKNSMRGVRRQAQAQNPERTLSKQAANDFNEVRKQALERKQNPVKKSDKPKVQMNGKLGTKEQKMEAFRDWYEHKKATTQKVNRRGQ